MQLPESSRLKPISIEDEMRSSFLEYSMSVIVSRALPDIRDGLKPVHRRILYAMQTLGNVSNRAYKKSARTVGEVIAKYHPHGDSAVYDSLVRMAQDFSLRYPFVDGQGNFGSVDGDSPAAMRYTEARLSKMAGEMLEDLDRDTVDFVTNYDESEQEPSVLPGKLPGLLINGTGGIAVGMATNIPPHNLREVVSALCLLIENPEMSIDELIGVIPGPDFPTGGEIHGKSGIRSAYHTGRGLVVMRGTASIEESDRNSRERIIITEIPYQVNKARMIEKIADLVRDKKITGISDIRDESDRHGMRVVIELKRDAIGQVILNQLYKHTQLQDTFGVIMIALVNGRPKQLNLKEVLSCFLEHRREIVTRRTLFDLAKANARRHILDGFKIALDNLSAIIELIRNAKSPDVAKEGLVDQFALSEVQAKSILEMRLSRLTGLERQKVLDELAEIVKTIESLEFIRDNESEKYRIIKDEVIGLAETYGDERRTRLLDVESEVDIEDLIPDDDMVIAISTGGYIKRNPLAEYKAQKRGGKGVRGISMKDEDVVQQLFSASNHTTLLFFTNQGRVFKKKVYEIPESGRVAKGKAIVNFLALRPDEKVARVLPVKEFSPTSFLLMATRKGIVKKTSLSAYANINVSGINAIDLVEGDSVISADITDGNKTVLLETKAGFAINFDESDARPMGRVSRGVRGIRLSTDADETIGMEILDKADDNIQTIFSIKDNGFGKRTDIARYPLQKRGGKGVIDIKTEGGSVITIKKVSQGDQLMIITRHGVVIRIEAMDVSQIGRNTKGVKVISVKGDDRVVSVAKIDAEAVVEVEVEAEAEAEAEENGEAGTQTE